VKSVGTGGRRVLQETSEQLPELGGLEPGDASLSLREQLLANLTAANLTQAEAEFILDGLNSSLASAGLIIQSNRLTIANPWMLGEPSLDTVVVSPVIQDLLDLLGSNNGSLSISDITQVIDDHKDAEAGNDISTVDVTDVQDNQTASGGDNQTASDGDNQTNPTNQSSNSTNGTASTVTPDPASNATT